MPRVGVSTVVGVLLRGLLALWLGVCPMLGATPGSPAAVPLAGGLPVPVEENENEEGSPAEVRAAVEWVAPSRADRRHAEPLAPHFALLPPPVRPAAAHAALPRPAPSDPFRNGLGCPPLC